jgi:hypothetical protein
MFVLTHLASFPLIYDKFWHRPSTKSKKTCWTVPFYGFLQQFGVPSIIKKPPMVMDGALVLEVQYFTQNWIKRKSMCLAESLCYRESLAIL